MHETEINKTISVFMSNGNAITTIMYTKSLDALVPVWEKLTEGSDYQMNLTGSTSYSMTNFFGRTGRVSSGVEEHKIQFTAAKATALAIKELG